MDAAALHPPPLSPESKPKTNWRRVLGIAGWAVGVAATGLVLDRFLDLDDAPALGLLAAFLVSMWLHTVIHEAGHALAGLAGGLKPVAFGLGHLRLQRTAGGWRFRWGGGIAGIGGFAMLLPPADAVPRRREQALYILGGPLSNLLLGVPALLLANAAPPGVWAILGFGFGVAGLVTGLVNLVPFKTAGWLSDGAHLLLLRRDPQGALDGFRVQQLMQVSSDGQRPRDWPAALLPEQPLPDPATDSPWATADLQLRLLAAIDRGEPERARVYARWIAARWLRAEPQERPGIALSMAEHAAQIEDDLELLRAWRPLGQGGLLDQSCHEAWLDAEIALREGREADARALLATARSALPRVHDGGTRTAVAEQLDALETRLATAVGTMSSAAKG